MTRGGLRRAAAALVSVILPERRHGRRPVQGAEMYVESRRGHVVALHSDGTVVSHETFDRLPTTAGDIPGYNGAEWVRVPVGANRHVLQVDTGTATKLAWSGRPGPAFTGLLSKDHDPASQTYSPGETVLVSYDVSDNAALMPLALRAPATVDANLNTLIRVEYSDASTTDFRNTNTGIALDLRIDAIVDGMAGDLSSTAANNGRRARFMRLIVDNTSGGGVTADIGAFRVRAHVFPAGSGTPI